MTQKICENIDRNILQKHSFYIDFLSKLSTNVMSHLKYKAGFIITLKGIK